MDNNELIHYGVLGMRWGVRKSKPSSHGRKNAKPAKDKAAFEAKKKIKENKKSKKPKKISDLSDDELKARIARLELERRYNDLNTAAALSKTSKGKKFAERVLEKSGENLAVQLANHYGAKGLNKLIGEEVIYANNKKKS